MTNTMMGLDDFAQRHQVSTKTVRRWLAAEKIPGATLVGNRWQIPADAAVNTTPPDTPHPSGTVAARQAPTATLDSILDVQPVYVPLDAAARLLGVDATVMVRNAEYFHLVRFGDRMPGHRRAWVMPKGRIRELDRGYLATDERGQ